MSTTSFRIGAAALLGVAGCASPKTSDGVDSVAVAAARADSLAKAAVVEGTALRDSAQATLATLLKNPATAVFDSVVVMQPPAVGDRLPPMVVCGRISGKPGIGGRAMPTRFVYQTKFALFVEDSANRQAFAELVGRTCGATGAHVVVP
jgi:hypothetical protein